MSTHSASGARGQSRGSQSATARRNARDLAYAKRFQTVVREYEARGLSRVDADQAARRALAAEDPKMVRQKARGDRLMAQFNGSETAGFRVTYAGVYGGEHRYLMTPLFASGIGPREVNVKQLRQTWQQESQRPAAQRARVASPKPSATAKPTRSRGSSARGTKAAKSTAERAPKPPAAESAPAPRTRAPSATARVTALRQEERRLDAEVTRAANAPKDPMHFHRTYVAWQTAQREYEAALAALTPAQRARAEAAIARAEGRAANAAPRRSRATQGTKKSA